MQQAVASFTPTSDASLLEAAASLLTTAAPATATPSTSPPGLSTQGKAATTATAQHGSNGGTVTLPGGGTVPMHLLGPQVRAWWHSTQSAQHHMCWQEAVAVSVELINTGKLDDAEALLNNVISTAPRDFAARLARGTARALTRNLQGTACSGSV